MFKTGYIQRGRDSGRIAYRCLQVGIIWEGGGVDFWGVAYTCRKVGYILGGRGSFRECRIQLGMEKGKYCGREG